ncbi:hypothetical protein T439DRAFT_324449 [Meredithblackwellia eburnea MCA 4105]
MLYNTKQIILFVTFLFFLSTFLNVVHGAPVPNALAKAEPEEGSSSGGSAVGKLWSKRCMYIGTFFKMIDCNAPANSTEIPFAPKQPAATALPA